MAARIPPLDPPYDAKLQSWLDAVMRGGRPLQLFTTLARDPRLFERPDEFRIDRPNAKVHIAFGRGPHACPGGPLATV